MTYNNPWPAKVAMTVEEASIAAGIGRRSIVRAISEGKLPSAFVLGRRRIKPIALERFMEGLPPEADGAPKFKTVSVSGRGC